MLNHFLKLFLWNIKPSLILKENNKTFKYENDDNTFWIVDELNPFWSEFFWRNNWLFI